MTPAEPWRLIDLGPMNAVDYVATNRAILDARADNQAPNTLTFLEFYEPAALVGYHQDIDQEIRRDYCQAQGIELQRRISGGGALYVNDGIVGWELYVNRQSMGRTDMLDIAEHICVAAADGLSRLGVEARFRPRNDIEVGGRKLVGTGGTYDGDVFLYHGSLLVEFDIGEMLRVLKIPAEKLSDKAIESARERVTDLTTLLGQRPARATIVEAMQVGFARHFGVSFETHSGLNAEEQQRFEAFRREVADPEWVDQVTRPDSEVGLHEGLYKAEGGLLRATVRVDDFRRRLKDVWITGDFFVHPRRRIADLEAYLRDTPVDDYPQRIATFFATHPTEMLLLQPGDFERAIASALGEPASGAKT